MNILCATDINFAPYCGIMLTSLLENNCRNAINYIGRRVATFENQATIDLGPLATGIYTLRMTLPKRIEVRRVVKQ